SQTPIRKPHPYFKGKTDVTASLPTNTQYSNYFLASSHDFSNPNADSFAALASPPPPTQTATATATNTATSTSALSNSLTSLPYNYSQAYYQPNQPIYSRPDHRY